MSERFVFETQTLLTTLFDPRVDVFQHFQPLLFSDTTKLPWKVVTRLQKALADDNSRKSTGGFCHSRNHNIVFAHALRRPPLIGRASATCNALQTQPVGCQVKPGEPASVSVPSLLPPLALVTCPPTRPQRLVRGFTRTACHVKILCLKYDLFQIR